MSQSYLVLANSITFECGSCNFQTKKYGSEWRKHLLEEGHQERAREGVKWMEVKMKRRSVVVFGVRRIPPAAILKYFGDLELVMEFVFWEERKDLCIITLLSPNFRECLTKSTHTLQNQPMWLRSFEEIHEEEWFSICPFVLHPVKTELIEGVNENFEGSSEDEEPGKSTGKRNNNVGGQSRRRKSTPLSGSGTNQVSVPPTSVQVKTERQDPIPLVPAPEVPDMSKYVRNNHGTHHFKIELPLRNSINSVTPDYLQSLWESFNYVVWKDCFDMSLFRLPTTEKDPFLFQLATGWKWTGIFPAFKVVLSSHTENKMNWAMQTKRTRKKNLIPIPYDSLKELLSEGIRTPSPSFHSLQDWNDVEGIFSFNCHVYAGSLQKGTSMIALNCSNLKSTKSIQVSRALKMNIISCYLNLWNDFVSQCIIDHFDRQKESQPNRKRKKVLKNKNVKAKAKKRKLQKESSSAFVDPQPELLICD